MAFLILSPFVLVPVAAWLGKQRPVWAATLALWPLGLAIWFANALRTIAAQGPFGVELPWAPGLGLTLSFYVDGLGALFALLITGIGSLIVLYATTYMAEHRHAGRFEATLFAFMGSMLGVVLADNLILLFVFWELTGFTSYLLIGFDHDRREARAAALQALLVTGTGGIALFAGAVLLAQVTGTVQLSALLAGGAAGPGGAGAEAGAATAAATVAAIQGSGTYAAIVALVLLAAFTKSAQVPFHFWLPNAMAAPTPVSAYLHAATMVKAGVYLVARMTPILGGSMVWTVAVTLAGTLTMTVGAWRAVQETDLKRVLAYSTVSALGILMLMLGLGTREAVIAALVYLVAHACYKGTLFLVAGSIEHEAGTRDVRALGGLARAMPITATAAALAAASMVGVPFFLGFFGKELFYEAELHIDPRSPWSAWTMVLIALGVLASALLGAAGLIAGVSPFFGRRAHGSASAGHNPVDEPEPAAAHGAVAAPYAPAGHGAAGHDPAEVHETPAALWIGPIVLAGLGLMLAVASGVLRLPLSLAATSVLREPTVVGLELWHGFTLTLGLSVVTLAGALGLYALREPIRRFAWPRSIGTERIYTGTLRALDAVSTAIAPALQSGSLRSYVLVFVLTAGTLIAVALVMGGATWLTPRTPDLRVHEVLVALLICAGALSAARAPSTMTAVISLGVVGYGVALMFLFFGAPDLAMTQFSVETLTAVIFVLVFRQFPKIRTLSPRLVRLRDALVATAFGAVIATLVLLVGSSGTASRLTDFFVDAGPRLAHGRNIVNVILVDFRAFDTLGEITVLVAAAIGVHALSRLGADNDSESGRGTGSGRGKAGGRGGAPVSRRES